MNQPHLAGTEFKCLMKTEIAIHCRYEKVLPVSQFKLHPANPKTHPPEQLRLYAKIIRKTGWRRSVVVSKRSGLVVKGNGAILACLAQGIPKAPAEFQTYRTEAEEMADLNADNALAGSGLVSHLLSLEGVGQALSPARKDSRPAQVPDGNHDHR